MDFVKEVEKRLDLPVGVKRDIIKELKSHYYALVKGLQESGKTKEEAEWQATRRMGYPDKVASNLQKVHCQSSWGSTILAALPFLVIALLSALRISPLPVFDTHLVEYIAMLFGMVLLAICIRAFNEDRRPVWLATWLPAGLMLLYASGKILVDKDYFGGLYIAVILAVGVYLMKRSMAGMISTVALGIAGLLMLYLGGKAWYTPCLLIMYTLGLILFVKHEYGNYTQSTLFLFTLVWLGMLAHASIGSGYERSLFAAKPPILFALIALCVSCVLYARASAWRLKQGMIILGVFLTWTFLFVAIGIQHTASDPLLVVWAGFIATAVSSLLIVPLPGLIRYYQVKKESRGGPLAA